MYVVTPSSELRQGDVFSLTYQVVQYQKHSSGRIDQVGCQLETHSVAILSQCCDLNPSKRPRIAIAPLLKAKKAPKSLDSQVAIADQQKILSAAASHVNYFVYQARPEWEGEDRVIDFTQLVYVPSGVIVGVQKQCELTLQARQGLRDRLQAHFARIPEEEEPLLVAANWYEDQIPILALPAENVSVAAPIALGLGVQMVTADVPPSESPSEKPDSSENGPTAG